MRDFEALRSEVYRRGEEKKLKIKKTRRRVIALCVPLLLCVTAAGLLPQTAKNSGVEDNMLFAPEYFYVESPQQEVVMDREPAMETQAAGSDSLVSSQIAVDVTSAEGWVWRSKETDVILDVSKALHAITGPQTQEYSPIRDEDAELGRTMAKGSYRIVFTDREGDRIIYLLTEDCLEVVADHLQFAVTPQQYAQLQSLLAP